MIFVQENAFENVVCKIAANYPDVSIQRQWYHEQDSHRFLLIKTIGACVNIKMLSYQYRDSHYMYKD